MTKAVEVAVGVPTPDTATPVLHPDDAGSAEQAALAGELVEAARRADAVLARAGADRSAGADRGAGGSAADLPARDELVRAAAVLAAVLAHRGMLARSADLHLWAETVAPGRVSPASAVALVAVGSARAVTSPEGASRVPTLGAAAEGLVARGVVASVRAGGSAAALSDLTHAAATLECRGLPVLQDDSPSALAALVALGRGEADLARSLLDRAMSTEVGGPAFRRRHLLLRAWTDMVAGDLADARAGLAVATEDPEPLEARDHLVAVALEAGLARRAGDTRALQVAWGRARDALLRHAVDLWSLLPIGELVVAAARLRGGPWLATHVRDAEELLAVLDHPPLWTAPWHWQGFTAALLAEDSNAAGRHAEALGESAALAAATTEGDSLAGMLAGTARRWLEVLDGHIDADAVTASAAALRDAGMAYDGARLAKEAAARMTDRRALTAMLGVARAVLPSGTNVLRPELLELESDAVPGPWTDRGGEGSTDPVEITDRAQGLSEAGATSVPEASPTAAASSPAGGLGARVAPATFARRAAAARSERHTADAPRANPLSRRESEVAALLLEGMTYRQVGERLFISAKTVEHHVGRIRQRLGSGSRTELFADLREALAS